MFEEFAVDPASFAQWEFFKELRDKFGLDKGRLIADFPHKGWKKAVVSLISAGRDRPHPIRNASTIEAWLRSPDGMTDSRFARRRRPYDEAKRWAMNAKAQAESFHAVVSGERIDATNAILLTETLSLDDVPGFEAKTQVRVRRADRDLISVAKPILRHARKAKWVDRYFDPGDRSKTGPLRHLLHWLESDVPQLRQIELHVERTDSFSGSTKAHYMRELGKLVPNGFVMWVFFWKPKTENLHPRFLLTDAGGLQYDYGLDRGTLPGETTIVVLMQRHMRDSEWQRYSIGSADLDLDEGEHVLEIKPRA